jgi:hypothetical protein
MQAVQTLNDRVKRINKINTEIADWLQVRAFSLINPSLDDRAQADMSAGASTGRRAVCYGLEETSTAEDSWPAV